MPPLLTVAVPAYRRVDLLQRCLESVVPGSDDTSRQIELVVSDNTPEPDVEQLVISFEQRWPGTVRYHRNPEGTGAVNNFNLCVERARGRFTLILHDDDYLLPGAIDTIVQTLQRVDPLRDRVLLFGVRVETLAGDVRRRQGVTTDTYLRPADAYRRLLRDSSFVRVPGLVVRTDAYRAVGGFRVEAYTTCDFDMSVRLFGRYGVRRIPVTTAVYTVHEGGVTTTVFNAGTVDLNWRAFDEAIRADVLPLRQIRRLQRQWYHQFILAGSWRALRSGDRRGAREILRLFSLPRVAALGHSVRWLPVRLVFTALSHADVRALDPAGRRSRADEPSTVDPRQDGPTAADW